MLEDLDDLVAGHDHVELYALPWSRRVAAAAIRRTDEPADPPAALAHLADRRAASTTPASDLLQRTGRPGSLRATPALGRLTGAAGLGQLQRLDDSHRVFASSRRVRFTESEWALPAGRGARGGARRCSP